MAKAEHEWSPDYHMAYSRRLAYVRKCRNNALLQKALLVYYKDHPADWINDWAITYNPRTTGLKTVPFLLFPRQEEFITFLQGCIEDKASGLVEKSRDVGATWLCSAYSVWLWLFVPGSAIGWGSRKEILVDRLGVPDSIFEKMRMLIDHLPLWMLPAGFDARKHATYMKIINPENGAVIIGESGDNIGRGGRTTIYFKDESAHYRHPELIEAALGDNTDVQIDISSVHGTGNVFYRRRQSGIEWASEKKIPAGKTRVFIFDWRHHPGKTQDWYERRRSKAADEGLLHLFAQEVDRDYSASVDGVIIPVAWIKAAIDAHIKLGFEVKGTRIAGQDIADEGGDKHAFAWRQGVILQGTWHWGDGDGGEAARRAMNLCKENGISEIYYDSIGVGAAFKAETNRLLDIGEVPKYLRILPWSAAASPIDPEKRIIEGDYQTPTNEDFFVNLKIQSWWRLRTRFEKTYKAFTQGAIYDSSELISLPSTLENLHVLERELTQAVYKSNGAGKLLVDKTPGNTSSPNIADAIVMCFNPTKVNSFEGVL